MLFSVNGVLGVSWGWYVVLGVEGDALGGECVLRTCRLFGREGVVREAVSRVFGRVVKAADSRSVLCAFCFTVVSMGSNPIGRRARLSLRGGLYLFPSPNVFSRSANLSSLFIFSAF